MTRDEAITIMQVYKEELEHRIAKIDYDAGAIDLYSIQVEAYDMAIEALQTERRNAIIDALDSVTFYNGLAEEVERWKDLEPSDYNSIKAPDNVVIPKTADDYQLQVIWMILVELWGDCGTSPRSGWLYTANKDHIDTFIDGITETEQAERRMTKGGDSECV